MPQTIDVWQFAKRERKFERPKREHKPRDKRDEKVASNQNAPAGERKPFDKDKPRRDKNFKGKERGGKDHGREKQSERRLVFSTENKKDKAADPNNPFAALAALKSQMNDKAS